MYQLVTLQAAWLVVIKTGTEIVLEVHLGQWHEDWSKPSIQHPIIQLQAGDDVVFKNIALDDQPYEMLVTRYPEVFQLEGYERAH